MIPQDIRAHLAVLRAEAHARYALQVKAHPHVFRWGGVEWSALPARRSARWFPDEA